MTFSEQVLPHNIEAEQSVLGAMLLERDSIVAVRLELRHHDDFYAAKHGLIYRAICHLHDKGRPVDLMTLQEALSKPVKGTAETYLSQVGGTSYLMTLMNTVPTTANAAEYAKIVASKATMRRLIMAAKRTEARVRELDAEHADPREAASAARAEAEAELRKVDVKQSGGLTSIAGIKERAAERLANQGKPDPKRIEFGLSLDLISWRRGEVLAIHAPSKNGKSTLTRALLLGAARKGQRAAYFSLEMGEDQVDMCLIAAEARIPLGKLRNMDRFPLKPDDQKAYTEAAERLSGLPLLLDYTPRQKFADIRSKVLQAAHRYGDIAVFAIDYADITGDDPAERERHEQMLIRLHYEAQWLAREINALAIMVDQAPIEMLKRPDPTPTMFDFEYARGIPKAVDHAGGLLIPGKCITSNNGRSTVTPSIPVPVKGVEPIPYSDDRWKNVLLYKTTAGRYNEADFLIPLYIEPESGRIGNLLHKPWEPTGRGPGVQAPDAPAEQRPQVEQKRWTLDVPAPEEDVF